MSWKRVGVRVGAAGPFLGRRNGLGCRCLQGKGCAQAYTQEQEKETARQKNLLRRCPASNPSNSSCAIKDSACRLPIYNAGLWLGSGAGRAFFVPNPAHGPLSIVSKCTRGNRPSRCLTCRTPLANLDRGMRRTKSPDSLPNPHAVCRGEVKLLSGLDTKC